MKNKKGFTLIELLAIIVILAIIAVITVPVILNIIDQSREGARRNSVIGYGKAVELSYTQYLYEEQLNSGTNSHIATAAEKAASDTANDGRVISITVDNNSTPINLKVDFDGDKVVCTPTGNDKNTISAGRLVLSGCSVNDSTNKYVYSDGDVQ